MTTPPLNPSGKQLSAEWDRWSETVERTKAMAEGARHEQDPMEARHLITPVLLHSQPNVEERFAEYAATRAEVERYYRSLRREDDPGLLSAGMIEEFARRFSVAGVAMQRIQTMRQPAFRVLGEAVLTTGAPWLAHIDRRLLSMRTRNLVVLDPGKIREREVSYSRLCELVGAHEYALVGLNVARAYGQKSGELKNLEAVSWHGLDELTAAYGEQLGGRGFRSVEATTASQPWRHNVPQWRKDSEIPPLVAFSGLTL